MHDACVDDERTDLPTVFDRLTAAGLSQERIEQHLAAGRVRLDGELCTDPDRLALPPARVVLWSVQIYECKATPASRCPTTVLPSWACQVGPPKWVATSLPLSSNRSARGASKLQLAPVSVVLHS